MFAQFLTLIINDDFKKWMAIRNNAHICCSPRLPCTILFPCGVASASSVSYFWGFVVIRRNGTRIRRINTDLFRGYLKSIF
jgi:hypothetical protein